MTNVSKVVFAAVIISFAAFITVPSSSAHTLVKGTVLQDSEKFIGTYRREFIGASGRVVELLDLRADLTATMTGEYENRGGVLREGNWTWARDRLIVTFAPVDIGGSPLVLEFKRSGGGWFRSGKNLKLKSSTPSGFAKEGIVYERIRSG